jgi:LysM repeat protein
MKKFIFLSFFLSILTGAFCQSDFIVQHNEKELFLNHKVAPKETFFSLGRMYNIAPKDIAEYNKVDMNKGLNIGQVIHIPLTNANFSQKSDKGKEVYYIVGEKEGLYRVSVKNNGVLMADLRKWNHLATDNISVGKKLIVGFVVNGEASTAAAATTIEKSIESPEEEKKQVTESSKMKETRK